MRDVPLGIFIAIVLVLLILVLLSPPTPPAIPPSIQLRIGVCCVCSDGLIVHLFVPSALLLTFRIMFAVWLRHLQKYCG